MPLLSVELEWMRPRQTRAASAFELVAAHTVFPPSTPPNPQKRSLFDRFIDHPNDVPRSIRWTGLVELERYQPLKNFADITLQLEAVNTPEKALVFYNRFGALEEFNPSKPGFSEPVKAILDFAKNCREFSWNYGRSGTKKFAEAIAKAGGVDLPISCHLAVDPKRRDLTLKFKAPTFERALAVQMFVNLTGDKVWRRCGYRGCDKTFAVGPGTKNRSDMRYCKDPEVGMGCKGLERDLRRLDRKNGKKGTS